MLARRVSRLLLTGLAFARRGRRGAFSLASFQRLAAQRRLRSFALGGVACFDLRGRMGLRGMASLIFRGGALSRGFGRGFNRRQPLAHRLFRFALARRALASGDRRLVLGGNALLGFGAQCGFGGLALGGGLFERAFGFARAFGAFARLRLRQRMRLGGAARLFLAGSVLFEGGQRVDVRLRARLGCLNFFQDLRDQGRALATRLRCLQGSSRGRFARPLLAQQLAFGLRARLGGVRLFRCQRRAALGLGGGAAFGLGALARQLPGLNFGVGARLRGVGRLAFVACALTGNALGILFGGEFGLRVRGRLLLGLRALRGEVGCFTRALQPRLRLSHCVLGSLGVGDGALRGHAFGV